MVWLFWVVWWSVGAVALSMLFVFDDATVKAFLSRVGFAPTLIIGCGYFLIPLVWQSFRDT